jgi:biotin operon repressor/anti-sigma regulatory factor (Ser/Thr protein kinase)
MSRIRSKGEEIRRFILENVEKSAGDIGKTTAEKFDISRQAVNKHVKKLVAEGCLSSEMGKARNRAYKLAPIVEWTKQYEISKNLAEDWVWSQDVTTFLGKQSENVVDIWRFGFTEMFNNAIDHSQGNQITVTARKTATTTEIVLRDDGIGIFKKIQRALGLLDERHAVLELAKGKFTTDPKHHTGEGIFFTSRIFDSFNIFSGGVVLSHEFGEEEDWIWERQTDKDGTVVWMKLNNHTARNYKKIFAEFEDGDDFGFTKTIVPVKLAQYDDDKLISRSQAKRLLARIEVFKTVIFDFKDVETIGQAFADEIFRVFQNSHPNMNVLQVNANEEVTKMIVRALTVRLNMEPTSQELLFPLPSE